MAIKQNKQKIVNRLRSQKKIKKDIKSVEKIGTPIGTVIAPPDERGFAPILIGENCTKLVNMKNCTAVNVGEVVCLNKNGKIVPMTPPYLSSLSPSSLSPSSLSLSSLSPSSSHKEVKIAVHKDLVRELLQTICSDLVGRDILRWEEDKKNDNIILVIKEKKEDKPNHKGYIGEIKSSKKISHEESFRRIKKVKQSSGKYVFKKVSN